MEASKIRVLAIGSTARARGFDRRSGGEAAFRPEEFVILIDDRASVVDLERAKKIVEGG